MWQRFTSAWLYCRVGIKVTQAEPRLPGADVRPSFSGDIQDSQAAPSSSMGENRGGGRARRPQEGQAIASNAASTEEASLTSTSSENRGFDSWVPQPGQPGAQGDVIPGSLLPMTALDTTEDSTDSDVAEENAGEQEGRAWQVAKMGI